MKLFYILTLVLFTSCAYANNYTTPGTGVRWNLDILLFNSGGDVSFSGGRYHINDTITVSLNDTLYITENAVVDFAIRTFIDVNGTLIIDPPSGVTFTEQVAGAGYYGIRVNGSNSTKLRKLTLEYAVSLRLSDCSIIIDSCIFRYNSPTTAFGNGAIALFRSSPVITNCQFLDNQRAAIQGGANVNNAPKIIGCLFRGNNTLNTNVPQINLGATSEGTDTVQIINNQILRASTNSGGIGFLPIGNVFVVIKGNIIRDNRYGMTFNGGANINALIINNQVENNNTQGDPNLGGSGISFTGGSAASQQNSIVTGNTFKGNLWGITIQGRSRPNLGNLTNTDTTDDGKNQFIGNTNPGTPGIDLYNNSIDLIYAQNNYWGTNDITEVEKKIFHRADNGAIGMVNYSNFMLPVELTVFTAVSEGRYISLNWKTASESNSDVFKVERSENGSEFLAIATVNASGSTSAVTAYKYLDKTVVAGHTVFYRLQLLDKDGRFAYSKIVVVQLATANPAQQVKVYPTTIAESRLLHTEISSSKKQTVTVTFSGPDGRQFNRITKQLLPGLNQFTISPGIVVPGGWIIVSVEGEGIRTSIPIFKR